MSGAGQRGRLNDERPETFARDDRSVWRCSRGRDIQNRSAGYRAYAKHLQRRRGDDKQQVVKRLSRRRLVKWQVGLWSVPFRRFGVAQGHGESCCWTGIARASAICS